MCHLFSGKNQTDFLANPILLWGFHSTFRPSPLAASATPALSKHGHQTLISFAPSRVCLWQPNLQPMHRCAQERKGPAPHAQLGRALLPFQNFSSSSTLLALWHLKCDICHLICSDCSGSSCLYRVESEV